MNNTPETTTTERTVAAESVENGGTSVCTAELPPIAPETPAGVCTAGFDAPAEPVYKKYATYIPLALGAAIILGAGFYMYSAFSTRGAVVATGNGTKIY